MGDDQKIDLKKEIPFYSARRGRFDLIDLPPMQYLMIDGAGDPNTAQAYRDALETLYPAAYAVKFFSKRELTSDYVVPPLEALWWAEDMKAFTVRRDKWRWSWTVMILTPEWIDAVHFDTAIAGVRAKGGAPRLDDLRFERFDEGLAVQTLHLGPYDEEGPVLDELHQRFVPESGLRLTGRHHEIYLSDARRTAPEKLRTILRQPVERLTV